MLKKALFFFVLATFSSELIAEPIYPWLNSLEKIDNSSLESRFDRYVIGVNPLAERFMSIEDQKEIIQLIHAELKKRGIVKASYLEEVCTRKASLVREDELCINYIQPEIVKLLIDLGYYSKEALISTLKQLDRKKLTENAFEVIRVLKEKSQLSQEDQQNIKDILRQEKKRRCSSAVKLTIRKIKEETQAGKDVFINKNFTQPIEDCITIKSLKKIFNQKNI